MGTASATANEVVPRAGDVYFSADVETDGPIPGPFSMLSFALVPAGRFDGQTFERATGKGDAFYAKLRPISDRYDPEALAVNGLDRDALIEGGLEPTDAMAQAMEWIDEHAGKQHPVLVAYPLSFDWLWLYWYFMRFLGESPFRHSHSFDIKTAVAVKCEIPVAGAGRKSLPGHLRARTPHTHHAVDDAIAQAEIFANVFEYLRPGGANDGEFRGPKETHR